MHGYEHTNNKLVGMVKIHTLRTGVEFIFEGKIYRMVCERRHYNQCRIKEVDGKTYICDYRNVDYFHIVDVATGEDRMVEGRHYVKVR